MSLAQFTILLTTVLHCLSDNSVSMFYPPVCLSVRQVDANTAVECGLHAWRTWDKNRRTCLSSQL